MPGVKTNEREGTRAVLRHYRMSASKARQVLDLIRDKDVTTAEEILRATPREAARVVAKVLNSAVSNARHNDGLDPEDLYVAACDADEGATLKRWRPRARGRATRIRKRMCHITVIVARLPDDRLQRRRATRSQGGAGSRARRVAASRGDEAGTEPETGNRATRRARARGIPIEGDEEAEAATDTDEVEAAAGEDVAGDDVAGEDAGDAGDADDQSGSAESDDETVVATADTDTDTDTDTDDEVATGAESAATTTDDEVATGAVTAADDDDDTAAGEGDDTTTDAADDNGPEADAGRAEERD